MNKLLIGSHVSMSKANKYFYGAVKNALEYGANTLMIYTGPPQNTKRVVLEEMELNSGLKLAQENNLNVSDFVIHAPYIINLATNKQEMRDFGIQFLIEEINRADYFGIKYLVLHPGSFVNQTLQSGIELLIDSLKQVITKTPKSNVIICLETMAGKGNEIGRNFQELANIISGCDNSNRLGVCFDTCHVHDAGYDLTNKKALLEEFDQTIGLDRLKVLHINDSGNIMGAKKDRHANIGFGHIGFDTLIDWIYDPLFNTIPKILETPYIEKQIVNNDIIKIESVPIYQLEIKFIKEKKWNKNHPKEWKLVFNVTSAKNMSHQKK